MAIAVRIARTATGKDKERYAVITAGRTGIWQPTCHSRRISPDRREMRIPAHASSGRASAAGHAAGGSASGAWPEPSDLSGYNQIEELDAAIRSCGDDLAAIVMEPTRSVDPCSWIPGRCLRNARTRPESPVSLRRRSSAIRN